MKKCKTQCSDCIFNGYSRDICKLHLKKSMAGNATDDQGGSWQSLGKKVVIGAGIGVIGMCAGLAVLPAFGVEAICGHALAAKMAGFGGAIGAGTSVAKSRRKPGRGGLKTKKGNLLLPRYWGKDK